MNPNSSGFNTLLGAECVEIRSDIGTSGPYFATSPGKKSSRAVVLRLNADVAGIVESSMVNFNLFPS
jgi:hypothetical protein